ncbi:MAG: Sir2 family NAD-dependent protein deacetylase [Pseudomonadota bacterium]
MPNVRVHSAFEPLTVSRRTPVFVLSGAGISAGSGVRTFRDAGGLWHSYRFEDVASPEAWAKDPALVWKFYSERRGQLTGIEPNCAHRALADLERQLDDAFFLCTQNVDSLHARQSFRGLRSRPGSAKPRSTVERELARTSSVSRKGTDSCSQPSCQRSLR